jgi:aspartyl-tRNA(Asn)/glutamyl-tRNA(Gln) amidotransferase subunit A
VGTSVTRRQALVAGVAGALAAHPGIAGASARPQRSKAGLLPDPASIEATDPELLSLVECAALLQARRLSATELAEACLRRSRAKDGAITAWVRVYPELAAELAAAADDRLSAAGVRRRGRRAPLVCGVPLALKDLYAVRGLPLTASSKVLEGHVATGDSTAWVRLKSAGMVLLGHAHTDEFAFGVGTPQTGNPWDPARSPGGSSGGSGAALAARFVPAATGTDTGGSLRLPASACGVTALKPSFGRVSAHGVIPLAWGRDHAGPMARSAADVALLLSYMAGGDQDDPASLALPPPPDGLYPLRASASPKPFAGKRFGLPQGAADGLPAATGALFSAFLDRVRGLGAEVVPVTMPQPPSSLDAELAEMGLYHEQFGPVALTQYRAEVAAEVTAGIAALQAPIRDRLTFQRDRTRYQHDYHRAFDRERLDCVVYPGSTVDGATRRELLGVTVFSGSVPGDVAWANYAGVPALCTPVGRSAATGMPFGVQLGGRAWGEAALLQLALDYQANDPSWAEIPALADSPHDIPVARVADVAPSPDPTGTDARPPAAHVIATPSSSSV